MINDFFNVLLPQGCLIFFIIIQLFMAMCAKQKFYKSARWISASGISLAIVLLSTVQTEPQYFAMRGALMSDIYTLMFHFIILSYSTTTIPFVKAVTPTSSRSL